MGIRTLSKPIIIGATATAVAAGVGGYVYHEERRPHVLEIYAFSVQGGLSYLIRTPEDRRVLINGGANSDIIAKISEILPFYSRRIDMVISTDATDKSASGLVDVIERYRVDDAYVPAFIPESVGIASSTDGAYRAFLDAAHERGIEVREITAGDRIDLDSNVSMRSLFPVPAARFSYSKASPPEIFLRIDYGSTSAVLLGGASVKAQKYIASSSTRDVSSADVLIVSHSALASNMNKKLIDSIRPHFFIYSKAENRTAPQIKPLSSKAMSKKLAEDPLSSIPESGRINIRGSGVVHFISDGEHLIRK